MLPPVPCLSTHTIPRHNTINYRFHWIAQNIGHFSWTPLCFHVSPAEKIRLFACDFTQSQNEDQFWLKPLLFYPKTQTSSISPPQDPMSTRNNGACIVYSNRFTGSVLQWTAVTILSCVWVMYLKHRIQFKPGMYGDQVLNCIKVYRNFSLPKKKVRYYQSADGSLARILANAIVSIVFL